MYFFLAGGIFLGWALGAGDTANLFGTAVSSKMVKYYHAVILTAVFVIIGACLQGQQGMNTLSGLTTQSIRTAFITTLAAAITITIMVILRLPISTSQAVIGAIIGISIMQQNIRFDTLAKVLICWVCTPLSGFVLTFLLFHLLSWIFGLVRPNIFTADSVLKIGLIAAGCYGAYALGANNVANVTGVFVGNLLTPAEAVLIGGASIALGTLTFGKVLIDSVGKSIVRLDAFSAFAAALSQALTVHIFAFLGVPVSTSQAIIGCITAIGFIKGIQTIHYASLFRVATGWIVVPVISAVLSIVIYVLFHLKYIP